MGVMVRGMSVLFMVPEEELEKNQAFAVELMKERSHAESRRRQTLHGTAWRPCISRKGHTKGVE